MAELKYAMPVAQVQRDNDIAAVVVPNALNVFGTLHTQGAKRLFVEAVVGIAPLTAFQILGRPTAASAYVVLYSTTADFTQPKGILVGTSGDLSTQAAGTGWFIMDVGSLESVQIKAQSGGTATLALNMGAI